MVRGCLVCMGPCCFSFLTSGCYVVYVQVMVASVNQVIMGALESCLVVWTVVSSNPSSNTLQSISHSRIHSVSSVSVTRGDLRWPRSDVVVGDITISMIIVVQTNDFNWLRSFCVYNV